MAISLPTSADVRKVRSRANKFVSDQFDVVRTPVLAWLGAGDLAVHTLRELPERLSRDKLRERANKAGEQARETYEELTERGEVTLERIRTQPQVARALRTVENANQRSNSVLEKVVDELHDAGADTLEAMSVETRSVGEKTARRAQRVAGETAATVSEAGDELAESIQEAGDEAAHDTRSATRKAANRTAPAKPTNGAPNARAPK
ncbi:MAG: heparin binding hemagglutinin HbhA [Pseudonocardiales bacterium]|nr:heparin binding hemagglutinin HbhA [Pseudonocardiales bacterium]